MILPWGEFERFGIKDSLSNWCLETVIPDCYMGGEVTDLDHSKWALGYEDHEHSAHRRKIPGIYLKRPEDIPHKCKSGWLALHKLKIYDKDCSRTLYREAVNEFIKVNSSYYPKQSPISQPYKSAGREPIMLRLKDPKERIAEVREWVFELGYWVRLMLGRQRYQSEGQFR
jgi:hypothetical protein